MGLLTLLLPIGGWQWLVQIEALLRENQDQSMLATSDGVALALGPTLQTSSLGHHAPRSLYVRSLNSDFSVDGYAAEWSAWRDSLSVLPAQWGGEMGRVGIAANRNRAWLLIEVNDDHPLYRGLRGDHVVITLTDQRRLVRVAITPGPPGSADVQATTADVEAQVVARRIQAAFQPTISGYAIELVMPRNMLGEQIGIEIIDHYDASDTPFRRGGTLAANESGVGLWPLAQRDSTLETALARVVPEGTRAWVVDRQGKVVAQAGTLSSQLDTDSAWYWLPGLVYRWLLSPQLADDTPREYDTIQLQGEEIDQAVLGIASTVWRPAAAQFTVVASSARPLTEAGKQLVLVLEQRSDALLLTANSALRRLMVYSMIALGITWLALFLFATRLSLRIRRLAAAADSALSQDGDLRAEIPDTSSRDELGDLARSFDHVMDELGQYNSYLKSLASKLSHELNTPLAVVRSSLDNLARHDLPDQATTYADRARDGAERLRLILRSLSEANRLEQAISNAESEGFDLAEVIVGCCRGYVHLVGERKLHTRIDGPFKLQGAPDLIAQMLDKLFDNAVGFTPQDGTIEITLDDEHGRPTLSISNTGPALPDHLRQRLFESMVSIRPHNSDNTHLGLGLHIVRLIARYHRAKVRANNLPNEQGVQFQVIFPRTGDQN